MCALLSNTEWSPMRGAQIPSFVRLHERTSNARTLSDLIIGYALILLAIWTPGITQRLFMFTAACWIAVTALRDNDVLYGYAPPTCVTPGGFLLQQRL